MGTPLRILVYTIPLDSVKNATGDQKTLLKSIANFKWNYICVLIATDSEHEDLASWSKTEHNNKYKTFKAVLANIEADDKGIINFCTSNIKVVNPDYVEDENTSETVAIIGEGMIGDCVVTKDNSE